MKIDAIRVADVGPFRTGLAVEGFGAGLNVLIAPNEAGKSTLFRALTYLFRELHTAQNPRTRALQSASGGGSPLVEVDFTIGDDRYRLAKRWFGQKFATLTDLGRAATLRGSDAEARLAELMAQGLDRAALAQVLWVEQASGPKAGPVEGAAGQALSGLVERQMADAVGGGEAHRVRQAVGRQLDLLLTPKRQGPRANTDYARTLAALEEMKPKLAAAQQQAREAEERLARLAALRQVRAGLTDAMRDAELERQLTSARAALVQATEAREQAQRSRERRDLAEARWKAAHEAFTAFEGQLTRLGLLAIAVDQGTARLDGCRVAVAGRTERRDAADAAERQATARLDQLKADVHRARRQHQRARLTEDLARARSQAKRAEEAAAAVAEAERLLVRIDAAAYKTLRDQTAERDRLAASLTAASPRVLFDLRSEAADRVTLDGAPVEADARLVVDGELVITIAGIGRIVVQAGGGSLATARERLHRLEQECASAATALGVATLAEAEHLVERARQSGERLNELRAAAQGAAPGGVGPFRAEVARVENELGGADATDSQPLPDLAALEAALGAAEGEAEVARRAAEAAWSELQDAVRDLALAEQDLARDRQDLDALTDQLMPADMRAERLTALRDAAQAGRRDLDRAIEDEVVWRAKAPDDAALAARVAAEAAVAGAIQERRDRLVQVDRDIAAVEGALGRDAAAGAGGVAADLAADVAALEARAGRYREEASALKLLEKVLDQVRAEDRVAVGEPVRLRLEAYARRILPGLGVTLDGAFQIAAVRRGDAVEQTGALSLGTVEQLAMLARLAYARLLADHGTPVPVVLDDPLVYADDGRLAGAVAVLAEAAQHHQIVVLSCHAAALAPLADAAGAHRLAFTAWEPVVR